MNGYVTFPQEIIDKLTAVNIGTRVTVKGAYLMCQNVINSNKPVMMPAVGGLFSSPFYIDVVSKEENSIIFSKVIRNADLFVSFKLIVQSDDLCHVAFG